MELLRRLAEGREKELGFVLFCFLIQFPGRKKKNRNYLTFKSVLLENNVLGSRISYFVETLI